MKSHVFSNSLVAFVPVVKLYTVSSTAAYQQIYVAYLGSFTLHFGLKYEIIYQLAL